MVDFGRRLHEKGFIAGTDGNLSLMVDKDLLLITPTGVPKGYLQEFDMILVNLQGELIAGKKSPSSELPMHLFIYKNRPGIKACCHAHPRYATAFSIIGKALPSDILPEVVLSVGEIPLIPYAPPGTEALPRSLENHIEKHTAFILQNHGALTIGRNLEEAYNRMETVEHFAGIVYIAELMGTVNHLDESEVKRLEKIRNSLKQVNGQ